MKICTKDVITTLEGNMRCGLGKGGSQCRREKL